MRLLHVLAPCVWLVGLRYSNERNSGYFNNSIITFKFLWLNFNNLWFSVHEMNNNNNYRYF